MIARCLPALIAGAAMVAGLALTLTLTAAPALAEPGIDPVAVLATKTAPQKTAPHKAALRDKDFSDRTARIGAIMGGEVERGARLRIPQRPDWTRPRTRAADALARAR